jgi:outer membrane protein W
VKKLILAICTFMCFQSTAFALLTELGLSYSYQKKTYNANNYSQSESKGASVSLYFFEKLALELSYTDSFYESEESDTSSTRTVQQSTTVFDSSLVYAIMDRKSIIQPYIKGGVAYIKKNSSVRYLNSSVIPIPESNGWAPSYGAGLKFVLNERFSIKFGYDAWKTSLSDGTKSEDSALKAGLSWYL